MTSLPALPALPAVPSVNQTVDSLGNIFDSSGNHVGVVQGSQADIGSAGAPAAPVTTAPSSNTFPNTTGQAIQSAAGTAFSSLKDTAKTNVNNLLHPVDAFTGMIYTSRLIFLVVGLLLFGAGIFQFRQTQAVIQGATKIAKKGAELSIIK